MTPPSAPRLKRYYTPAEVGEILGIGLTTVYELIHRGEIPSIKVGRQYRIPIDPFHKWEAEQINHPERASAGLLGWIRSLWPLR